MKQHSSSKKCQLKFISQHERKPIWQQRSDKVTMDFSEAENVSLITMGSNLKVLEMHILKFFYICNIFKSIIFPFPFHHFWGKLLFFHHSIIHRQVSWVLLSKHIENMTKPPPLPPWFKPSYHQLMLRSHPILSYIPSKLNLR